MRVHPPRPVTALCVLTLLSLTALPGCRTLRDSSLFKDEAAASFIGRLEAAGAESVALPVVKPSEVWKRVIAAGGDNDAARVVEAMLLQTLVGQDRGLINAMLTAGIGESLGALQSVILLAGQGPATAAEITVLSGALFQIIKASPELLDIMATFDVATLPPMQETLFKRGVGDGTTTGLKPFVVPMAAPALDLTAADCRLPEDTYQTLNVTIAGELLLGRPQIREGVTPCFHQTSAALATQLNLLANNALAGGTDTFEVRLPDAAPVSVSSYKGLLTALQGAGYTIEFFTTRAFVEFRSFLWKDASGLSSVQHVTWASGVAAGPNGPRRLRTPTEHGEIGMLLYKDGVRAAQVRWYAGIPEADYGTQSAWWRPHPELAAPWAAPVHEKVDVYDDKAPIDGAVDWLLAAAHDMRAYQAINLAFQPPYNSYGLLVCTDSLSTHAAKLAELREEPARYTEAFPVLRGQFNVNSRETFEGFFERYASSPSGSLSTRYPVDTVAARDPALWQARLRAAFPLAGPDRYQHYPAFRQLLETQVHAAP